ncbi:10 kDa chaperonin [Muribaculaceae bacterium]|jgi:chaperonin GroES|uniref:co-chaperone GroES n=1 Tax=Paramuribaculum intestinale TaxID=2094151 RepID=UPI000B247BD7|nr:co-chaperone GroES [Paramuribaculum intestinale]MCX4260158.1 co-chaperone GroES [Muribaculaceae bacterium]GFI06704.1 10 kDa chaperonin [Muribaculaceae bacterium]
MNIKPLADRVLIQPTPAEEVTMAGIIIPDSAKEKPLKGEVLAVGNGTKDEEMVLKAGDKVLYGKYAGTEIELAGEKYLIMRQSDVLAVIND